MAVGERSRPRPRVLAFVPARRAPPSPLHRRFEAGWTAAEIPLSTLAFPKIGNEAATVLAFQRPHVEHGDDGGLGDRIASCKPNERGRLRKYRCRATSGFGTRT